MSKAGAPENLIIDGKRLDGRKLNEMRPVEAEAGMLKGATGSATIKFGDTYALAAVQGPRNLHPRFKQNPLKAILRTKYAMVPFSTKQRIRPGYSRRGTEISKVINEALSNVVFFDDYPKTVIDVFIEIIQADASTRCAGLTAASMALAQAGVPMRDLVSCCSVGKIQDQIVVDLYGIEDNFGQVDLAFASVGITNQVVLLQMDGIITREEFTTMLKLANDTCKEIHKKQKEALEEAYKGE